MKQGPLQGALDCETAGDVVPESSRLPPLLEVGGDARRFL